MKLFTKYSRINLAATILIFLISGVAFYYAISYFLINQIDADLKIEEVEIKAYVKEYNRLPETISVKDQVVSYTAINTPFTERYFSQTKIVDPEEKNSENFRQLVFGTKVGETWYKVTVSKSLEDTDAMIRSILLITSVTILLMLIVSFILNRVMLKRLWKPFYETLDVIKNFQVGKKQKISFPTSKTEEFDFMNQTLERLTSQAQVDYLALKTFTENASHEIQTPLAIIRSKLDLLIQNERLTEEQSQTLQSAYTAIQKLSNLNQSLLLLAKIENNQFEELQEVDLKKRIEEKLNDFNELWQSQNIIVNSELQNVVLNINSELADVLLNNLFSNATKHNFRGGNINIILVDHELKVINSSRNAALDEKKLFSRFYKSFAGSENNGLGLSIIKQICDASSLHIRYSYHDGQHAFTISW